MAWHDGGCVFAAGCKYAARRRYDAERVARAYGECVRRVFGDCSRQSSFCVGLLKKDKNIFW